MLGANLNILACTVVILDCCIAAGAPDGRQIGHWLRSYCILEQKQKDGIRWQNDCVRVGLL